MAGTKSRVETQIKLSFELCIPASPSSSFPSSSSQGLSLDTSSSRHSSSSSSCSNSTSTSPPLHSKDLPPGADDKPQQVTHDKVGTYKFLLLPQGTTTKRRSVNSSGAKREPKLCGMYSLDLTYPLEAPVLTHETRCRLTRDIANDC